VKDVVVSVVFPVTTFEEVVVVLAEAVVEEDEGEVVVVVVVGRVRKGETPVCRVHGILIVVGRTE
jgi:hypothetical protein